jgi:poly(3-hydroxyoctanoate) depolymerase
VPAPSPDRRVIRFIDIGADRVRLRTAAHLGQISAISGWTSLPWLRTLRHRTLVLAGDDDPIVPVANGRILTRCIPQAQLHIVRRGGHLFLLDSAAEMAGLVAAFLSGDNRPPHPPAY